MLFIVTICLIINDYSNIIGLLLFKFCLQCMHNASPVIPITICGTVVKESDDLVILGVTIDSKMAFEKHFRSVSRTASQ